MPVDRIRHVLNHGLPWQPDRISFYRQLNTFPGDFLDAADELADEGDQAVTADPAAPPLQDDLPQLLCRHLCSIRHSRSPIAWYRPMHRIWFDHFADRELAPLRCLVELARHSSPDPMTVVRSLRDLTPLFRDHTLARLNPNRLVDIRRLHHLYIAEAYLGYSACSMDLAHHMLAQHRLNEPPPVTPETRLTHYELLARYATGLGIWHQAHRFLEYGLHLLRCSSIIPHVRSVDHFLVWGYYLESINRHSRALDCYRLAYSNATIRRSGQTPSYHTRTASLFGQARCHAVLEQYDLVLASLNLAAPLMGPPAPASAAYTGQDLALRAAIFARTTGTPAQLSLARAVTPPNPNPALIHDLIAANDLHLPPPMHHDHRPLDYPAPQLDPAYSPPPEPWRPDA